MFPNCSWDLLDLKREGLSSFYPCYTVRSGPGLGGNEVPCAQKCHIGGKTLGKVPQWVHSERGCLCAGRACSGVSLGSVMFGFCLFVCLFLLLFPF